MIVAASRAVAPRALQTQNQNQVSATNPKLELAHSPRSQRSLTTLWQLLAAQPGATGHTLTATALSPHHSRN